MDTLQYPVACGYRCGYGTCLIFVFYWNKIKSLHTPWDSNLPSTRMLKETWNSFYYRAGKQCQEQCN